MAPYTQPSSAGQYQPTGLWAQTATIDWCESNYELSYYVAEFWNTLSNLAFILPQLSQYMALSQCKSVEPAFRRAFLSLALVGLGSFCFHMTLARPMQMFDETSMILVSLHGFYLLYIIRVPQVNRRLLLTLLICYGLVFLSLYMFLVDWPIFHHTAFGLLVYASMAIGYGLKQQYGPHYKFWTVLIMQHLGFTFWLIDKHYCDLLSQFRENHLPVFLRPALQFHALWHLLMGLGSHIFFCGIIRLRAWTKYKKELVIRYKFYGLWVQLEQIDQTESQPVNLDLQQSHPELIKHLSKPKRRTLSTDDQDNDILDLNQNQVHNNGDFRSKYSA